MTLPFESIVTNAPIKACLYSLKVVSEPQVYKRKKKVLLVKARAVRLILTLHGRRSLPVTAKVALLDTTFKEYQHALIGALVTTLSNGSVILTIAHNFTMRLPDPTICQRLKIQIQLVGVIQDSNAE
ncbi:hypothetical protein AHAS_Ahas11G0117800 [Arachis hypogaea]